MRAVLLFALLTHVSSRSVVRKLESDDHHLAHAHGRELCGCAKDEPDHPFKIDCDDKAYIKKAYEGLQKCEKDGAATKEACESKNADGVMECQRDFFILQATHDYCRHDTLTYAQEEYVHVWEGSCMKCGIERQYDEKLVDCPKIVCSDSSVVDAAFYVLNTTCVAADNTVEYEWGGIFDTPLDLYEWVSQPTGDNPPYEWVDPTMNMAFIPTTSDSESTLLDLSGPTKEADMLLQGTCVPVQDKETIKPSKTQCFQFNFSTGQDDFVAYIDTKDVDYLAIFAQHVPTEFERTSHYFRTPDGTDVEPVHQVGAPAGHDHGHRRRLGQKRRLGSKGSCCNNDPQIGAFKQIVAYHDMCDHDDIPTYVEVGLHDYEASCEDYFCNAVSPGYDGTICPSPPSPPAPPPPEVVPNDSIPDGALVGIIVASVCAGLLCIGLAVMYTREKSGNPIFTNLEPQAAAAPTRTGGEAKA